MLTWFPAVFTYRSVSLTICWVSPYSLTVYILKCQFFLEQLTLKVHTSTGTTDGQQPFPFPVEKKISPSSHFWHYASEDDRLRAPHNPGPPRERELHIFLNFETIHLWTKSSVFQDTIPNQHPFSHYKSILTIVFLSHFLKPKSPVLLPNIIC